MLLSELDMKPVFRSRKISYTRQRTQRCSFKRRKLFERSMISTSDGGIHSDVLPKSLEKVISGEGTGVAATMHQGLFLFNSSPSFVFPLFLSSSLKLYGISPLFFFFQKKISCAAKILVILCSKQGVVSSNRS